MDDRSNHQTSQRLGPHERVSGAAVSVTVRVPHELVTAFEAKCARDQLTRSSVVRRAIQAYVDGQPFFPMFLSPLWREALEIAASKNEEGTPRQGSPLSKTSMPPRPACSP